MVFLAGVGTGYGLAQEKVRQQLHEVMMAGGALVDRQVAAIMERVRGEPVRSGDAGGTNQAVKPVEPPLPDPREYIRAHIGISELRAVRPQDAPGTAVVSGKIINSGGQPIKRLGVSLFFMGPDDIVLDLKMPVLTVEANGNKAFSWKVEKVPANWQGKIRASVTEIIF